MSHPELFAPQEPLAARMRPVSLDEFVGQEQLLAPGRPLGDAIRRGDVASSIFWGPPGTGKTTLARLIATTTDRHFVPFSAVSDGVSRVREIIKEASGRLALGRGTILFVDEIHRFNRAQQDAFLTAVEQGIITLIGATTENPSFELNAALLSRARVWVLEALSTAAIGVLLDRAVSDPRGLGGAVTLTPDGRELLARVADGDARRALSILEASAQHVGSGGTITPEVVEGAMARRLPSHDKSGEQHYDLISALHKAVRGSDPQASLYWLARILNGGEDPMFVARRLVRMASEDIGLADPAAVAHAIAARDAFHFLGSPEGELALAEITVYLATAPKSNRVYVAWQAARAAAEDSPAAPVPLHIRNAPTSLMKDLGYGKGYRYAFDDPASFLPQQYLPDALREAEFYHPGEFGYERRIAERMAWWKNRADAEAHRSERSETGD
jgi:putative ATPase